MKIRIASALLLLFWGSLVCAQPKEHDLKQSLESLHSLSKPLIIYVSADWCTICLKLKSEVFQDPEVSKFIDSHFQFSTFLPEIYRHPIRFNKTEYVFKKRGIGLGEHEFADFLFSKESLIYPSVFLILLNQQTISISKGYLSKEDLLEKLQPFI
jgi:thioredoxin-related protein